MGVTGLEGRTEFGWERPVGGCRWFDGKDSKDRPVRYLVPLGLEKPETIYPLESPELLRRFAELEVTEEAVLAFANRYGPLMDLDRPRGIGSEVAVAGNLARGEKLETWKREIELIRAVLGIWDCVADEDRRGLRKWFSRDGSHFAYVGPGFLGDPYHLVDSDASDLLDVAAEIVALLIDIHFGDDVRWKHIYSLEKRWIETFSQPESLRAAIWSQFSQLTRGGADHRRCRQCGAWFEIAVGRKRSDSLFDKDACKSKAYRTRKANAIRMKQQGMKRRDIAKKLDTDLAVIRGWIDPTKRKPKPVTTVDRLRTRHRRKVKQAQAKRQ